jgi:hypothetical protein
LKLKLKSENAACAGGGPQRWLRCVVECTMGQGSIGSRPPTHPPARPASRPQTPPLPPPPHTHTPRPATRCLP